MREVEGYFRRLLGALHADARTARVTIDYTAYDTTGVAVVHATPR